MKRRNFLKNSGHFALSSTYIYGLQALIETCLQSNLLHAASTADEINYVNFQLPGAPPRWMFDQPLNPTNAGNSFNAGQFGTHIVKSGGDFSVAHRGVKVNFGGKDVWLPPVWGLNSASVGEPIANLLQHSMMIRGIDMEINSHGVNQQRIVRPVNSQPSITGLVADKSGKPLAAIGTEGVSVSAAFKSLNGISILQADMANPIPQMIDAFKGPITKASEMDYDVADAIAAMDQYASDRVLSSAGSEKQQMAAFEMFERNLDSFQQNWQRLFTKYQNIVKAELVANFPNVTSINPVGNASSEVHRYFQGANDYIVGPYKDQITSDTSVINLARGFAFAEFALMEGLSSSLSVSLGSQTITGGKSFGNIVNDQHFTGSVSSVYFSSIMYRALLSCMLEFTNRLKEKGVFDNTVLHVMSEFSRTPKADGSGSDHGFNSGSALLISGMFSEPGLIGNIRVNDPSTSNANRYPGTWGLAAPFFKDSDRHMVNDDIVKTICEMMQIQKIAVKGQSLVKKSGGKVTLAGDWEAKNVG